MLSAKDVFFELVSAQLAEALMTKGKSVHQGFSWIYPVIYTFISQTCMMIDGRWPNIVTCMILSLLTRLVES